MASSLYKKYAVKSQGKNKKQFYAIQNKNNKKIPI